MKSLYNIFKQQGIPETLISILPPSSIGITDNEQIILLGLHNFMFYPITRWKEQLKQ